MQSLRDKWEGRKKKGSDWDCCFFIMRISVVTVLLQQIVGEFKGDIDACIAGGGRKRCILCQIMATVCLQRRREEMTTVNAVECCLNMHMFVRTETQYMTAYNSRKSYQARNYVDDCSAFH